MVLAPTVALVLAAMFCRSWSWLGWAAFGVVLFGFMEYVVHRWLLHRLFWSGYHQRHHTHPSEHVVFPWWFLPSFFVGFMVVLPWSVFAGVLIGYTWFTCFHQALHHLNLDRHLLIGRYADWHNLHHIDLHGNYGISHPLFDLLFGSYISTARAAEIIRDRR